MISLSCFYDLFVMACMVVSLFFRFLKFVEIWSVSMFLFMSLYDSSGFLFFFDLMVSVDCSMIFAKKTMTFM